MRIPGSILHRTPRPALPARTGTRRSSKPQKLSSRLDALDLPRKHKPELTAKTGVQKRAVKTSGWLSQKGGPHRFAIGADEPAPAAKAVARHIEDEGWLD